MVLLRPSAKILTPIDPVYVHKLIETAARLCYQSEGNSDGTYEGSMTFNKSKLDIGHHSVIEHFSISAQIICDRGVSHEIVRHRLASYSQESTRYCNYMNDKYGSEIKVIDIRNGMNLNLRMKDFPPSQIMEIWNVWYEAMSDAEKHYSRMIKLGAPPEIARSVLPNSTKTELIMTMNIREWIHFFIMRTPYAAHCQMREITVPLLGEFQAALPVFFDGVKLPEAA